MKESECVCEYVSKHGRYFPLRGCLALDHLGRWVVYCNTLQWLALTHVPTSSHPCFTMQTYFAFYGVACNVISTRTDLPPSAVAFSAGAIAAAGSSVVKVPLAVCIRSVQAGVYPNVFQAAKSIIAAAGPRGLFTGYLPTLMEDVPDMAIKFAAYEGMRQLISKLNGGRPPSGQEDFVVGAAAGALAAAATTPLDVIKTNMMCMAASRPSMMSATRMVYSQGGPSAFFRGVGTRALSNGINSAVFFCFFEALRGAIAANKAKASAAAMHAEAEAQAAASQSE
jgi:hypothetical protein